MRTGTAVRVLRRHLPRSGVRRGTRREPPDPATWARTSRWSPTRSTVSPLEQVRPHAEHVHRANADIPESVIAGLAELGGFGLSVPEEFGGFATGGESEYLGMVVATEELSWGALGRRRIADHPAGDPDARPREGWHPRTEGALAATTGLRRSPGGGRRDRTGLRQRRRRRSPRARPRPTAAG